MTKLAKLEDYKAPWEVNSEGADVPDDEQVIDKTKLKKYLHGLLSDKDRLQTTVTTVTGERDELQTKLTDAVKKTENDEQRQERERQEALDAAKASGGLEALKLDVALDIEGITPKQAKTLAKSLAGKDRAELVAHAESLVELFGIGKPKANEDEGHEEELQAAPTGRPRTPRAAGDPEPMTPALPKSDAKTVNEVFPRR